MSTPYRRSSPAEEPGSGDRPAGRPRRDGTREARRKLQGEHRKQKAGSGKPKTDRQRLAEELRRQLSESEGGSSGRRTPGARGTDRHGTDARGRSEGASAAAGDIRSRVVCPSCASETYVHLERLATDLVLCGCGEKINVSLEKYALRGREKDPGAGYPRMLGPHKLLRQLGRGGSSVVHLGVDPLGRSVAVKELRGTKQDWQLARREASCNIRCSCLNVVNTFEIREEERAIVQEYVEGETLRRVMIARSREAEARTGGPFPPLQAVEIMLQVLHGLQVCHVRGVIHLDIKPDNIIMDTSTGMTIPKITDFGLARNLHQERERTPSGRIVLGRRPGDAAFEGTPSYAAPEQVDPQRKHLISRRTDTFQAGVLFYELLTGQLPFPGKNWREIFGAILAWQPVPLARRQRGLPLQLIRIQERMCEEEPENRYASVADVIEELENWRAANSVVQYMESTVRTRRTRFLATLALGLALGGGLGVVVAYRSLQVATGPEPGTRTERVSVQMRRVLQVAREVRTTLVQADAAIESDSSSSRAEALLRRAEEQFEVLNRLVGSTSEVFRLRADLERVQRRVRGH